MIPNYGTLYRENSHNVFHQEDDSKLLVSNRQAFRLTIKSVVGSGFLALPFAFKESGLVGLFILISVWALTVYTTSILVRIASFLLLDDRDTDVSYSGLIEIGLHGYERTLATFAFIIAQYSATVTYLVLVDATIGPILVSYGLVDRQNSTQVILVTCTLVQGLLALLPSPAFLNGVASFGNAAFAACMIVIATFCVMYKPPVLSNVTLYESFDGLVTNFGISAFTLAAHAEVLAIYESCSYNVQKHYDGIATKAVTTAAVIFTLFAILAYSSFGPQCKQDIFENIETSSVDADIIVVLVKVTVSLMVLCNFPLCMFPIHQLNELHIAPQGTPLAILLRQILVAGSGATAYAFGPRFGVVTTLAGACTAVLSFVLPPILYFKLVAGSFDRLSLFDQVVVVFVVGCGCIGSSMAIVTGIRDFL